MSQLAPPFGSGSGLRFAAGALAALAHILLVFALLRFAGMPDARHAEAPVDYIAFAFIPAGRPPVSETTPAPLPVAEPARRSRRAAAPAEAAISPPPVAMTPEAPSSTQRQQAPMQAPRIDMESLRAAARQVESERVPSALESLRASEQMRASDDSDLSRAVRRAKRPDCQTKYAEGRTTVNLLLLIPLAIETVTDKGCKW